MLNWDRKAIFKFAFSAFFILAFAVLFMPFTAEILLAAIFAFAMEPAIGRWLQPKHFRYKTSVALILLGMFIALALPVSFVGYRVYRYFVEIAQKGVQENELYQKLVLLKGSVVNLVNSITQRLGLEGGQYDLGAMADDALGRTVNAVVQYATAIASNVPALMISLFIFCAALYFFLAEARWLRSAFMKQKLLTHLESDRLIRLLQASSYSVVVTSIVIASIQASIVAVGALIFHAGDVAVIWLTTFFFSFIPVIGAGPVALVLGAFQLVMGNYGYAIGFVVVAVIAGTTDNLVRPYLLSSDQDIHPILSLLSIIGAIILFGIPGLFLGPVIAAVAIKVIPVLYGGENVEPPIADGKGRSKKET